MEAQLLPKGPLAPLGPLVPSLEGWDLPGDVTKGSPTHMSHLLLLASVLCLTVTRAEWGGHCCTRVPNGEARARARARPSGATHWSLLPAWLPPGWLPGLLSPVGSKHLLSSLFSRPGQSPRGPGGGHGYGLEGWCLAGGWPGREGVRPGTRGASCWKRCLLGGEGDTCVPTTRSLSQDPGRAGPPGQGLCWVGTWLHRARWPERLFAEETSRGRQNPTFAVLPLCWVG